MVRIAVPASAVELPLPISDIQRNEPIDFASEILPILQRNCLACHHEKEAEGGLVLETLASIRKGGDSGEGVVAKDLESSQIFIRASGIEEPLMPPEDNKVVVQPLSPEELGLLKLWIQQGASGSDATPSESIRWQRIPESIRTVYAMDVTPDGTLAVIGRANRIVLVDLLSGAEVGSLIDPSLPVGEVADFDLIQSIAASPNGQRIATGGYRTVRIWQKMTASVDPSATPLSLAIGRIAIKADGSTTAINAIGDIEVWDLANDLRLQTLSGHRDRIIGLEWSGATDRLSSADEAGRLVLWDSSTAKQLAEFDAAATLVQIAASRNGRYAASIDAAGKVLVVGISDEGSAMNRIDDVAGDISDATAIALAGTDAPMLAVTTGTMARLFSLDSKQLLREVDHGAVVDAIAITHDQTRLVTGGRDGKTRLWNLADGKSILTMEGDSQSHIMLAKATRDTARQTASVQRLKKQAEELEKLLAAENELLKKATEERDKTNTSVEAEEKKRLDAPRSSRLPKRISPK